MESSKSEISNNDTSEDFYKIKLLSVIFSENNEVVVKIVKESFQTIPAELRMESIANIIQQASINTLEESEHFHTDPVYCNYLIPINEGSLYDDVIFETTVYVTSYGNLQINTTFGKLSNPHIKLGEGLRKVSDVLLIASNYYAPLESLEEIPQTDKIAV